MEYEEPKYTEIKVFEDFEEDQEDKVKEWIIAKSLTSCLPWYIVNYGEDGAYVYECPTQKDAEGLLKAWHTEGSHSDHDTYEVYHNGQEHEYEISATIK